MGCRKPKWAKPQPLLTAGEHLELSDKPGVYRIRAFTKQGKPRCISRAGGVDREGILHIGQSHKLRERIGNFRRSAARGTRVHKAGSEFFKWGFPKLFPLRDLRFDFVYTDTKEEAEQREKCLHAQYRKKFLDRPPLDARAG